MLRLLLQALLALGAPAADGWERFPVLLWPDGPGVSALTREFGGACALRLDEARELRELGLDYLVFNAPGRDDLHVERESPRYAARWQRWYDTRDPALLVREPCLTAAATRERLAKLLAESLRARDGRHGLGVSLGDEVGLTAGGGPEDLCQCADCEAAWKRFAAPRGVELALAAVTTEGALARLAAGETQALGPWLLRREFHQQVLLDQLGELARLARELAPSTPVGLLGLAGQTAFGGVAVERVLPQLDFVECYRVGDARELAFTLRRSEQRALATVFLDERGPALTAWQAWEFWMRGGDGLVVWSEAQLAKAPEQRARLAQAAADIRALQARVGRFRPRPRGIALVHSAKSSAAGWLRDALEDGKTWPKRFASYQEQHGALERSRKRWLELLEDAGAMPGAVPLEELDAATAARFPLLVLDHVLVLDDADLERLKRFAAAGGRLCVVGELGWIDSRGRKPAGGRLQALAALAPDPLRAAPRALASYSGGRESLAALEDAWRAEIAAQGAPFGVEDPQRAWTWLRTWMEDGDGYLCAALPKPRALGPGKRADALPQQVEVAAGERWRVEWLHPLPGADGAVHLPPGDAAVFRLAPRR